MTGIQLGEALSLTRRLKTNYIQPIEIMKFNPGHFNGTATWVTILFLAFFTLLKLFKVKIYLPTGIEVIAAVRTHETTRALDTLFVAAIETFGHIAGSAQVSDRADGRWERSDQR